MARVQVWIWFSLGINLLLFLVYHREWERRSYNHRWHTKSLFSCAESPGKHLQKTSCVRGFLQEASVLYLTVSRGRLALHLTESARLLAISSCPPGTFSSFVSLEVDVMLMFLKPLFLLMEDCFSLPSLCWSGLLVAVRWFSPSALLCTEWLLICMFYLPPDGELRA